MNIINDNNELIATSQDLNLKSIFPNYYIIYIKDFSTKNPKKIFPHLKEELLTYNNAYGYISYDTYTHINQDTIKTKTLKETSKTMIKIIKI